MTALLTIFFFIVILGFLVLIHEFGHFAAAKLQGIAVFQFAIGFGPIIYEAEYKGTRYQIRALPLGGFVELEGEHSKEVENGFRERPFYQKFIVLIAGVTMNFLFAIIFLFANLIIQDYRITIPDFVDYDFSNVESQESAVAIRITSVVEGGNSDGQLEVDEFIIGIGGTRFESESEFLSLVAESELQTREFEFLNIDTFETYERNVEVGEADEDGRILQVGYFGREGLLDQPIYYLKYEKSLLSPIAQAFDLSAYQMLALGDIIVSSAEEGDFSEAAETVGGPVAVGNSVREVVELEVFEVLFFLSAMISISLAVFNILPIPALDGGQIVVAAIESVRKKRFSDDKIRLINGIGFAFLMSLFVLTFIKDLFQFNVIGGFIDLISSALGR